jgi:hypothetical protein
MRIPQQVTERVKEAPAQALRAVFSGIGQVLLVADRIKTRAAELQRETPPDPGPRAESVRRAQSAAPSSPAAEPESRWRSLDETGNVRLLSQEERAAAEPAPVPEPAPEPEPAPAAATGPEAVAEPEAAPEPEAVVEPEAAPEPEAVVEPEAAPEPEAVPEPEAARSAAEPALSAADQVVLPVPNYDELTIASLRARLRNLDSSQVRALLDYEKAHAGRDAVVMMFERRIAKLDSGEA